MANIDDLFKKPLLPSKRKSEPLRDASELYKSAKVDANGDVSSSRAAAVEDTLEEEDEAGPELPPDFNHDEDILDDEEGRFFGGGISRDTAGALDFVEKLDQGDTGPEKIDSAWLRRLALNFEKRISKNAELRAKFENEPQKFMASEADLDADIKSLSILSEHPDLYKEFASLGCVGSLVSLLSHENTDIAIDAIEILGELTDEDVEAEQEEWDVLVTAMVDADVIALLAQNLARLDEGNDADRSGVYHVMSVLENLASQLPTAEKIGQYSDMITWLKNRIQKKEKPVTQNKQYAAEILAILVQSSAKNRQQLIENNMVDVLLQLLSAYRKLDPEKDSDEEEYVENLFDCLTCLVDEDEGKAKFLDAEGVELAQIMLREGKMSKLRALRVLNHALGGQGGAPVCERLIEAAVLRTIFGMFMKKQDHQSIEHLLGIFSSLLRLLPGESSSRIRTLAKFMEKDYEKIEKLVKLRREYASKVSAVDQVIDQERKPMNPDEQELMAGEWLSRRLDAGLFCLQQTIDVILAWLVAEDDGAKMKIKTLLSDRDEDFSVIKATLQEQLNGLDETTTDELDTREMLGTLLQFL
ncbi:beta-catenin-like protein 1 [[Emmonsia] crescens]|uniref:Beta-catenin-like protein 1 n=1 Tax=[Emmonsia] crescens TaxID=73230 RepID=A0A2B7ZK66_9EURO|nr:beta-catenin-like protein 1 [Emmonsia crescens]